MTLILAKIPGYVLPRSVYCYLPLRSGSLSLCMSQEPGQARRASRPPSLSRSVFELDRPHAPDHFSSSQRSALFPWDNAGASSSINGAAFELPRERSGSFGRADDKVRRSSSFGSRRGSSLLPGGIPASPVDLGFKHSYMSGGDFEFEGKSVMAGPR